MLTTTDVREEASAAMTAEAMGSRFDAIDRKLVDIDLNLERRSAGLRNDMATVRMRIVELREQVQERLFELDRRLYRLTRDVAALQRGAPGAGEPEPAGAPGADYGERQDAGPG